MEKSDMKIPVIDVHEKDTRASGRYITFLAGSVALLALAFIVLIVCGAWAIQSQSCEQPPKEHNPGNQESYDVDVPTNDSDVTLSEHVTMLTDLQLEFAVARDSKSGLVHYVTMIDYGKGLTAAYIAETHECFLKMGIHRDFEEDLAYLQNQQKNDGQNKVYVKDGAPVTDASDIPEQLTPFCSISNSHWLEDSDEEMRSKRGLVCYYRLLYCDYRYCYWRRTCYIVG